MGELARFDGFGSAAFEWFAGLEGDNSREYFAGSREIWQSEVRGPLESMLEELTDRYEGRVKMFRQNRDVRFSADKSPYKTSTYGLIIEMPGTENGLYAQLSSSGMYAGSGYHEFAADQLARYRSAVDEPRAGRELERLLADANEAKLDLWGSALKTVPRGYPRDHPRAELLRHKAVYSGRALKTSRGISRKRALEHTTGTWDSGAGLARWLDRHVGASEVPPEERFGRGRGRR